MQLPYFHSEIPDSFAKFQSIRTFAKDRQSECSLSDRSGTIINTVVVLAWLSILDGIRKSLLAVVIGFVAGATASWLVVDTNPVRTLRIHKMRLIHFLKRTRFFLMKGKHQLAT